MASKVQHMLILLKFHKVEGVIQNGKGHSFSTYAKLTEKTNISYTLIRTRLFAYQGTHTFVCVSGGKKF